MRITPLILAFFGIIPVSKSAPYTCFPDEKHSGNHKIIIEEVIQTTSYTYLHAKENDSLKWFALPKMVAGKGETYYYTEGMPMQEFESKELHRTFDEVLFLAGVSSQPYTNE